MDKHGIPALDLIQDKEVSCILIQTAQGIFEGYTPHKIKLTHMVSDARAMMGNPNEAMLKDMVSSNAF